MRAEHAGQRGNLHKEQQDEENGLFTRVRLLRCREKTLYRLMMPLGRDGG